MNLASEAEGEDAVVLKRHIEEHVEMDITPLIDITFLLLIFFVITAKVAEDNSVPLPPAKYGAAVTKKEAVVISVLKTDAELPNVFKGEGANEKNRILAATALEQDEEIAKYVQEELTKSADLQAVLIHADKALPSREVNRIARAACRMGNVKLFYKVQEE